VNFNAKLYVPLCVPNMNLVNSNFYSLYFVTPSQELLELNSLRRRAGTISTSHMPVHGVTYLRHFTYPTLVTIEANISKPNPAHRTQIIRELKGLQDIISLSVVHWHMGSKGWRFATQEEVAESPEMTAAPEPLNGATYLQDIYFKADPQYSGRYTVPILWDKKTNTIVNNESSEIIRFLYTEFDDLVDEKFRGNPFYPEDKRGVIDELNSWVYDTINNGVYKSGIATKQGAYEDAVTALFASLDCVEALLKSSAGPYLLGEKITEADVRLYPTIIRFDPVYVQHFKCNIGMIRHEYAPSSSLHSLKKVRKLTIKSYPAIHKWLRHLYWEVPAFKKTTNFEHIKKVSGQEQTQNFSATVV